MDDQPPSSEGWEKPMVRLHRRIRRRPDSNCRTSHKAGQHASTSRIRKRRPAVSFLALGLALSASIPSGTVLANGNDEETHNLLRRTTGGGRIHNDRGDISTAKGDPSLTLDLVGGGQQGRGDDIFDHDGYEESYLKQRPIPRHKQNNVARPSLKQPEYDGVVLGQSSNEETSYGHERPMPISAKEQYKQEQKHQELASCMSMLADFTASSGSTDEEPRLITKDGILDLLSDVTATATQKKQESRSTPPPDMKWTDLPLSLVMQYNYASCSGSGKCTAMGEGVTLIDVGDGDATVSVANGALSQQPRNGNVANYAATKRIDWPLRMLCREVTEYARELATTASFAAEDVGSDYDYASTTTDASNSPDAKAPFADIELHYKFVVANVSYAFYQDIREGRLSLVGGNVGVLGRIRQRGMLKKRLILATEGVVRQYLGCPTNLMEEEDILPLLNENEMKATWVHRSHKMNTQDKTKDGNEVQRRGKTANKRNWQRHRSHLINNRYKTKQGNEYEGGSENDEVTVQVETSLRTIGLESAMYGGCDIDISVNIETLQQITCQDAATLGCALVETTLYVAPEGGKELIVDGSVLNVDEAKNGLSKAIQTAIQSGYFEQLMMHNYMH